MPALRGEAVTAAWGLLLAGLLFGMWVGFMLGLQFRDYDETPVGVEPGHWFNDNVPTKKRHGREA